MPTLMNDLVEVRKLLSDPMRWTQGSWARGGEHMVLPTDSRADRWCVVGAITAVADELPMCWTRRGYSMFVSLVDASAVSSWNQPPAGWAHDWLTKWNDFPSRTHGEVLERLDDVIARIEEEELMAASPPNNPYPVIVKHVERELEDA